MFNCFSNISDLFIFETKLSLIFFILELTEIPISLDLFKLIDCLLSVEISLCTLESVNRIFSRDSSKVLEALIVILTPFQLHHCLFQNF